MQDCNNSNKLNRESTNLKLFYIGVAFLTSIHLIHPLNPNNKYIYHTLLESTWKIKVYIPLCH